MQETPLRPPPPLAKRLALLIGFVTLVVLGLAIGTRLVSALADQAALEQMRADTAAAAGGAASVPVTRPVPAQTAPVVVLTGTLEPAQAADLVFEVPGRVARVHVSLGQTVEAGEVLVTLDRASVGAQSASSTAAIGVAEANAEMTRDRVRLYERLVSSGTMAERELITARQQLAVSEAQLQQARAGHRQVAATSANHILRAPFAGVITRVPSGVGVAASPAVPLVRVEDLSSLRLRTTVNRQDLEVIEVGMTAAFDGSGAVGTLDAVVRSLDAETRRAPVEVRVANADGALVANAFVRATVTVGGNRAVLRIPSTARRPDGVVYVVGEGSRIEAREVTADAEPDGSWLVSDGLTEADRVVLRPALVREGVVVAPVEEGAAPSATAALEP